MSWNIFDTVDIVLEVLDGLSGSSATPRSDIARKSEKRKRYKYNVECMSAGMAFISSVILFSILKDPLPVQHPVQTIVIIASIGVFISSVICLGLYFVTLFYFRNIFSMLFFCCSLILFSTSMVLWMYFKSGLL
ncbi:branched-chain amino acid ABC transporter substrate-binding protein [Chryseobacterium sp. T16E-39]|uniref:branched-chain amino acid ABC transporter substrate-binding protein n=1 Tax=Chryseobacterium sp. T16E-39 TaxID=2015076 RepID=UPI000B5B0D67|nr:branched-chain amino acid ABC transporter substrate-binding protein [Chryseobacterium sp. T16E-39]ASK32450.1 branched-chain amino acid ABC transporter substrate-binding protein [Chryseobacterium sp. T16E-39]